MNDPIQYRYIQLLKALPWILLLWLVLAALGLISCSKGDCKKCHALVTSNELRICGRENNGFEEIGRQNLGEICDAGDIAELRQMTNNTRTVPSALCPNSKFQIKTELICQ